MCVTKYYNTMYIHCIRMCLLIINLVNDKHNRQVNYTVFIAGMISNSIYSALPRYRKYTNRVMSVAKLLKLTDAMDQGLQQSFGRRATSILRRLRIYNVGYRDTCSVSLSSLTSASPKLRFLETNIHFLSYDSLRFFRRITISFTTTTTWERKQNKLGTPALGLRQVKSVKLD